jgi:hypothetical protein
MRRKLLFPRLESAYSFFGRPNPRNPDRANNRGGRGDFRLVPKGHQGVKTSNRISLDRRTYKQNSCKKLQVVRLSRVFLFYEPQLHIHQGNAVFVGSVELHQLISWASFEFRPNWPVSPKTYFLFLRNRFILAIPPPLSCSQSGPITFRH